MRLYIVTILSLLFLGCMKESWFDVKSNKQLSVPTTITDLQSLMDDGYSMNSYSPMMGENASDAHYFEENRVRRLVGFALNSYTWSKLQPNRQVTDWVAINFGSYRRVYVANLVLENLQKIKLEDNVDKSKLLDIKGQALFFRGRAFYELSQIFVPFPDASIMDKKYGIPLRLESDINLKSVRSTVNETYNRIISDLKEAADLLPLYAPIKTRPSKGAAFAQLARVYLGMENYGEALKYADLALGLNSKLIDYSSLQYTSTDSPFDPYNDETIFYSFISGGSFLLSNVRIDSILFRSYQDDDLRKVAYYNYDPVRNVTQFKGTYSGPGQGTFFSGLATDELYLIRAECYARSGRINESMIDLNVLLKTRWRDKETYVDIKATSTEEALAIVLQERKKELVLRGVRWTDLRRLNRDPRFVQTFTRTVNGKVYTLEPNSYKYTFPIPDDIIEVTGMQQNPGWE